MRIFIPPHSVAAYGETTLVIATGAFFALLCVLLFIAEAIVKLIVIPVIFAFGVSVLVFDFARKICREPSL